jgi:uncharacterized repeat protein (TIGR03803 family)
MNKHCWLKTIALLGAFFALTVTSSAAPTFTTLGSLDGTDGASPGYGALLQGWNGNFYGTTSGGGVHSDGAVFKIAIGGQLDPVYSFCSKMDCDDGETPFAALVQATDGSFYGTTYYGGASDEGTVFKITTGGGLATLYNFCSASSCTDGENPYAGLVQDTTGNFYGTTYSGGANAEGTIFEITAGGKLTTLYSFCSLSHCTDGEEPFASLIQATNGNFYGITYGGGASGDGTIFEISTAGKLTTLYSFDFTHGSEPYGTLIQAANGNFYGTTHSGGAYGGGTLFEITALGKLTMLHSFDAPDGRYPEAGLVQATDGNFYGTTASGGANSEGTIFEITAGGNLTTLYSFCSRPDCTDGATPIAPLMQATNGNFYGTTEEGGAEDNGAVFSLAVGLGPFVETLPTSGKVGAAVIILGNSLTGATRVTFNGTPATFKVVSGTELTTTIPSGASTGKVEVTTSSGTLTSNVNFRVP